MLGGFSIFEYLNYLDDILLNRKFDTDAQNLKKSRVGGRC